MLRPVIFIGCGGSGTKAVRYVRDAVLRRLEHCGWDRGMPDAWQFIGLDTLTVQESPTEIPTIPAADFLSLSGTFDTYRGLWEALTARHPTGDPNLGARLLCGWLPDPRAVNIPLRDGAGQNRGIGRAAGLLSLKHALLGRLRTAFQRAAAGGPLLREVGTYLGIEAEIGGETAAPLVTVCSSMAGGTGAGVVLDVVDLVRACDPAGGHPALVLFTNDIFDLPDSRPMAANSLGLMSEMLAAYWSEPGEIKSPLRIGTVQDPGSGPHSIFLVGRYSQSGADLGDTAEVYRASGEALSTWVVDGAVQERIHNFINVNWRNSAKSNHGGYPFGREHQYGAVSSFGAAKVTVGRDRFSLWAEHLLAREVLESLSRGHLRLSHFAERSPDDTDQELVDKAGRRHAEDINQGRHSGPSPAGSDARGCASAPEAFAPEHEMREVRARVRAELEFPSPPATSDRWRDLLRRRGSEQADKWSQRAESKQERDLDWCEAMLVATCRSVSEVAASASLDVAAAALGHVINEINPAEVNRVLEMAQSDDSKYRQRVEAALSGLDAHDGDLAGDSPQVREAADSVAQGVAFRWRSLRRRAAADSMKAAGDQVFGAIQRAVQAARAEAGIAMEGDDVKGWPTAVNDIAKRYLPSTVELPLESHGAWPQLIGELSAEADPGGVSYGNRSTDPLRYRLIAGDGEMAPLVRPGKQPRWQPGQHADVVCHAGSQDIEERVRGWTRQPGAKFNRVIGEGLRSYLAETDPDTGERRTDHARRMEVFREQLGNARQASDPLMRIDRDVYTLTNSNELEPFLTVCSQFPFGEDHPAEEAARSIIGEASYAASVQDTSSVLISSYVKSPTYPMAVKSFTDPVAEALQDSLDQAQRSSDFWMWRRGRTLEAFVPVPRETLRAMISGFAVARLCGYITADPTKQITITAAADEARFPWPLLTTLRNYDDLVAALLEGFSLTFGLVGSGGMKVYECYTRLHDLGLPSLRGRIHDDLQSLLESGAPPHATAGDETPKATGDTAARRRTAAVRYLEVNLEYFRQQRPDATTEHMMRGIDGSAESGAMTTELAPIYIECYQALRDLLSDRSQTGSVI
ncbi:MAG: hypothetical protein F4110_14310 [Acidimicrobiaceae bacterium]|nr:hypothetical protein [Acidimicrobiaceae bacterium]MXZ98147.1 hypothetical protein [Acidimicrobiaceae bacterium]MYE76877.1 hypothetical protein [Acidimicrobiaceae bacterium]MYE95889.1 hypothetical protein [Acidimicrobiaceae bacterium]MYH44990.1 hypothetical protein [Acidimicrobiaceae bacterium]